MLTCLYQQRCKTAACFSKKKSEAVLSTKFIFINFKCVVCVFTIVVNENIKK